MTLPFTSWKHFVKFEEYRLITEGNYPEETYHAHGSLLIVRKRFDTRITERRFDGLLKIVDVHLTIFFTADESV